jgi:hypothetical protein
MYYYNQNNLQRMKIRKNEFTPKLSFVQKPEAMIEPVIYPFFPMIQERNIKIYICKKNEFNFEI